MTPDITVDQLETAAEAALDLDTLLGQCVNAKLIPLQVGWDLDYLATLFGAAADRLRSKGA